MVMSSLGFLFAEHIPESVLEKPAGLEIPMGTYRKRPSKSCFLEPKHQKKGSLVKQKTFRKEPIYFRRNYGPTLIHASKDQVGRLDFM